MGKRLNKIRQIILDNWDRNAKKILVAIGVCLIAVATESVIPISMYLNNGSLWGTFFSNSYKYLIVLASFIIGAVFGKAENGNNGE